VGERGEHEPKPLNELMRALVAGRGWHERMSLGRLRDEWASVVGPDVAARSEPVALARGVLTIRADGSAWANELTLLARSVADKADSHLGGGAVHEVKVTAGGPLRSAQERPGSGA
jgi:predicted nucleic acid-binding Zn ribbon protein